MTTSIKVRWLVVTQKTRNWISENLRVSIEINRKCYYIKIIISYLHLGLTSRKVLSEGTMAYSIAQSLILHEKEKT